MNKITALSNPLVKEIKSLHSRKGRDKAGLFIIEGLKLVNDAIKAGLPVRLIAYNESCPVDYIHQNVDIEQYIFSDEVMKKVSTTDSPVSIIAVARKPETKKDILPAICQKSSLVVILDNISDPGNLGTIIRTCCGAGIDALLLAGDSVDLYNPKVIRSSAGLAWKMQVIKVKDKQQLVDQLKSSKFRIIVADAKAEYCYYDRVYGQKAAIVFGSESHGVSDIFIQAADPAVKIPISQDVESLNVAISAAIILFEARRQKDTKDE